jgi:CubicO group peptidase (beta-lactamase class C family)
MADRITRPLKMHLTSFSDPNGGSVNPSGGAISTASDFMNFLAMLMNKGVFEGKRILSEKAVADMETSQFVQLPIRYVPKGGEDYHFGLGTWIGQDRVICSPNLNGNWPFIDLCRNYAALLFVKTSTSEPKREIYKQFKQSIDNQFPAICP